MNRKNLNSEFALDVSILCRDGWLMTSREHFEFAAWILTRLAAPAHVLLVDTKTRYQQPAVRRPHVLLLRGGLGCAGGRVTTLFRWTRPSYSTKSRKKCTFAASAVSLSKALNSILFAVTTYGSQSVLDGILTLETYTRVLLHHTSSSFVDKSCNQISFFCSLPFDSAHLLACFGGLTHSQHMVSWFVECYRCAEAELNGTSYRPVTGGAGQRI